MILAGVTGRLAAVRDALGRNLFDLPRSDEQTLLTSWCERFSRSFGETAYIPVLLAIDENSPEPMLATSGGGVRLLANRDVESSRGTAGILRDLTREFAETDDVLVVQASDLAWDWTLAEAGELGASLADVVLSADRDLRPAGFMRVRCRLLRRVPSIGFVDLKEQFLARCSGSCEVHIVQSRRRQSGSLHSLQAYLTMIGLGADPDGDEGSLAGASPWRADRAIVERGAEVDPSAILFDSVVLAGARIGARAVVVRSLVGEGVIVSHDEEVVDQVLVAPAMRGRQSRDVRW